LRLALRYRAIMKDELDLDGPGPFVVRLWDGMDGAWTDVTGPVSAAEALKVWFERTDDGTHKVSFDEIDYFKIFHANTKMKWSGDKEMFR